jgi:hypothetical protein
MSKFNDILKAAKEREPEPEPEQPIQPESQPKKLGRPRGKRSNPDYEQVTAYIKKSTYTAIKIALLQSDEGQEFSELVEELLTDWLSTQNSKNSNT